MEGHTSSGDVMELCPKYNVWVDEEWVVKGEQVTHSCQHLTELNSFLKSSLTMDDQRIDYV